MVLKDIADDECSPCRNAKDSQIDEPPPFSDLFTGDGIPASSSFDIGEFEAIGNSPIPNVSAKTTHVQHPPFLTDEKSSILAS